LGAGGPGSDGCGAAVGPAGVVPVPVVLPGPAAPTGWLGLAGYAPPGAAGVAGVDAAPETAPLSRGWQRIPLSVNAVGSGFASR
jgi:hypothetical protein